MHRNMKEQTTRERILEAAEELMLEKSFHSVGLKQLLDAVKVPKGSFYHYFESKEQFGVEMLKHYVHAASTHKRQNLLSSEKIADPLERLFTYLEGSVTFMNANPGTYPCLAVKLAAEVADLSDAMRMEMSNGFDEWIGIYAQVFNEAIEQGLLPDDVDVSSESQFIQDSWAGAVQRAVTNRSADPVSNSIRIIKTRIYNMKP